MERKHASAANGIIMDDDDDDDDDDGGGGGGEEFEIGRHEWKRERQPTLLFRCIIY